MSWDSPYNSEDSYLYQTYGIQYDNSDFLTIDEDRRSNNTTGDHDYALRLQRAYDEESVEEPDRAQSRDQTSTSEDTTCDEAYARELHQILNGESDDSNIRSIDVSSLEDMGFEDLRIQPQLIQPPSRRYFSNEDQLFDYPGYSIYVNNNPTEDYDEPNEVSPSEIIQHDLGSIISEFKKKLHQKHPEARTAYIRLSSRNSDIMFTEFIAAVKEFREADFVLQPKVIFRNEPALDAGGVFNDTIRQILEIFMSLENPEYGGDGHLFTGDASKLISSTAPVHFVEELDAFGDVLYLAVIHNVPFPNDLDIILFKYCLSLESTISLDDLKEFSTPMYNLARNVYNAQPNVKLSTIEGFDQWAEEKEINAMQKELYSRSRGNLRKLGKLICEDVLINSRINQLKAINKKFNKFGFFDVLKAKRIGIEHIRNYFYREIVTPNDIIQKLMFDGNLNHRQNKVRIWLIDWLKMQGKTKLQEFCRLVTGFKNPRERFKVSFKPYLREESREIQLTPKFATCFHEIKLSENFSSRREFYSIMNAQVDQTIHDNRFTTA